MLNRKRNKIGTNYYNKKEIIVLGPDVNRSYYQFEIEGKNIRVGLTSIKGLALKTAEKWSLW